MRPSGRLEGRRSEPHEPRATAGVRRGGRAVRRVPAVVSRTALRRDHVVRRARRPGDRALEIGAGTGKATMKVIERGLARARARTEPRHGRGVARARVSRSRRRRSRSGRRRAGAYRLVYAAQAWHWVGGDDRYERAAAALAPGGTLALFWSRPQEFEGALGAEIDAIYDRLAPEMRSGSPKRWRLDETLDEIAGCAGIRRARQARGHVDAPVHDAPVRPAHRDALRPPRPLRRPADADPRRGGKGDRRPRRPRRRRVRHPRVPGEASVRARFRPFTGASAT